jgi:hypothetical protein
MLKNILAENMRRFKTKNLTEQTEPTGSVGTAYNAYDRIQQYTVPIGKEGEPIYIMDGEFSASEFNLDSVRKYTKTKLLTKDEMKQYLKFHESDISNDDTAFILDTSTSKPVLVNLRNLKPYKGTSRTSYYNRETDQMLNNPTATRYIGKRTDLIPPYPYNPETDPFRLKRNN